jgi:tetratricopeptide (TPR) repeat protein
MKAVVLILALLQSVEEVYKSANADFDAGRWNDAAAKYEQVLKEDPSHIPSRFNLAVSYSKAGKVDAAIAAYRTLLEQNSTIYEAQFNLAVLLDQAGKRTEAGEQFEKALALRPDDQSELNLATFYLRGNEPDKAYPHLVRLAEKGLNSAELYIALSEIERARKNDVKSREYVEKAIQIDSNNTRLLRQLAASYYEEKNYPKAVPVLERLTKLEPGNADALYLLGKSYEQLKAYPQALATMQEVLRIQPDSFEAYGTIGAIFYAREDWARAAQALTQLVALRPRDAVPRFVLATCFDKLGNAKEALVHYNKFLELDDGSNDARSFQARERARTLDRRLKR